MIFSKKILSFGIPAALVLCAGIAAVAYTGGGNCKAKATKASASVQATGDEASGCCASKAKATTASNTTASNSCASSKATNASDDRFEHYRFQQLCELQGDQRLQHSFEQLR